MNRRNKEIEFPDREFENGVEDGVEAPVRYVSVLRDPRFEERPPLRGTAIPAPVKPPLSAKEKRERRYAQFLAARPAENDHFQCSACGTKVERPKDMSLYDWERLRRCPTCIASNRHPPKGKRYCRADGELFTPKGCERFCSRHHR